MDALQVYREIGVPPIDDGMDHGLGLHDALADHIRTQIADHFRSGIGAKKQADRQVVGELLRRLEMVRRMIDAYDRDLRVGVQYRFSAAEHVCSVCERALARYNTSTERAASVGGRPSPTPDPLSAGAMGDGAAAPPRMALRPDGDDSVVVPGSASETDDLPVAPPGGEPPPGPIPGGWYKFGRCDPKTGRGIAYCRWYDPFSEPEPDDKILAGPFADFSDCERWRPPSGWCQREEPPPPPEPPKGGVCLWPLTGAPVLNPGECCRVIGGAGSPWGYCGPGTQLCQGWVMCGPGDGSWAISWTPRADPPKSAEPPGPGWVRVPWELPDDEYRRWWADWLASCGAPYDPSLIVPANACEYYPPIHPPPPGPPEPPPDDPPVEPPGPPPLVCPAEPQWVGL